MTDGPTRPLIYDAHEHIDVRQIAAGEDGDYRMLRKDFDARIELMQEEDIAATILMPSYDYDKRFGMAGTQRAIEALVEYQSWDPDRIRWLGLTVEPQHYEGAVAQLREALETGRFRVASWHNRYQGLSIDHPVMFEFVELASEYGCVVLLHGNNTDHEEPWRVSRIARAFPETRFIVTSTLGGSFGQMTDFLQEASNVWIDTAGAGIFVKHLRGVIPSVVGWDRVLFGSDLYNAHRGGTPQLMRQWLDACELDDETLKRICGENLLALMENKNS